ncbi:hypothetical protein [Chengkuizengella marina]|uniref:Uncharacterized protein n=1 Tax=Chengkuizengella marina TaxID=2507566 RepID=A0A6N9Q270_9BACL|nr:hypothetical protein [Chengkuizengella marina]NBI28058.1 hypothetical protein [Chengkuizengella marina]
MITSIILIIGSISTIGGKETIVTINELRISQKEVISFSKTMSNLDAIYEQIIDIVREIIKLVLRK